MSTTDKQVERITVGSADIFINGVDVGNIKEAVTFEYKREKLAFKPANCMGDVVVFAIKEKAIITCKCAELRLKNIRDALGLSTTQVIGSTTMPAQTGSCSYTPDADTSWDYLKFGGDKSERTFCVRLEHTRPNGKKFIVILYKAISMSELSIPFVEDQFTMHDLVFKGLNDQTRSEGDQLGIMLDQTN